MLSDLPIVYCLFYKYGCVSCQSVCVLCMCTSSFTHYSPDRAHVRPGTSAETPRSHLPQLLLPDRVRVHPRTSAEAPQSCPPQLLLPDCVCLSCCSPTMSASARILVVRILGLPNRVRFSCCLQIASASLLNLCNCAIFSHNLCRVRCLGSEVVQRSCITSQFHPPNIPLLSLTDRQTPLKFMCVVCVSMCVRVFVCVSLCVCVCYMYVCVYVCVCWRGGVARDLPLEVETTMCYRIHLVRLVFKTHIVVF